MIITLPTLLPIPVLPFLHTDKHILHHRDYYSAVSEKTCFTKSATYKLGFATEDHFHSCSFWRLTLIKSTFCTRNTATNFCEKRHATISVLHVSSAWKMLVWPLSAYIVFLNLFNPPHPGHECNTDIPPLSRSRNLATQLEQLSKVLQWRPLPWWECGQTPATA